MRHIDLFGTILLPALMYLATAKSGHPMVFGYAKPVPIDFSRLRNPKKQMAWVALAGPLSNFVMAFGWLVFAMLLAFTKVSEPYPHAVARAGVLVNIIMFVFNLVPIPPLDGSRVLASLLPNRAAYQYSKLEPYGFFIVMGLLYFHLLDYWFFPMMALTQGALRLVATPLTFLLG